MKHDRIRFLPDDKTVTIHRGATLLEAAGLAGIILSTPCGGAGRCGKCKVILQPSQKAALACQYTVTHDVEVQIPDASRFFKQQILEHGIGQTLPADPAVQKIYLRESVTTVVEVVDLITQRLQGPVLPDPTPASMDTLDSEPEGITAVLLSDHNTDADSSENSLHLIDMEKGDTTAHIFGAAIDIGTTTVLLRLINLQTLETVATVSAANPQSRYGSDVISRIEFAETDAGRTTLRDSIVACLNDLLHRAACKAGVHSQHIYEAVVVSNTTMNHLLLNYPVRQLGQAPYQAHSILPVTHQGQTLGVGIHPRGGLYTPANIAGFVGSDTVSAALACGLDRTEAVTLLVDIGTNGELVLGTKDRLLAASCAAGPALEGAGITFGSRAQDGAIERVIYDQDDIDVDIIGQRQAVSICGSGLIDAVAVLLEAGVIDATGRFADPGELVLLPTNMQKRLIRRQNEPAFMLTGIENPQTAVVVTQKDVRQIQLAKAAVQAGILLLLKNSGLDAVRIQQVFLAGAFGNYIQKTSALRIGLLPDIPAERIHFVGNAAGSGAQMLLINRRMRRFSEQFARRMEYLEIAHQAEFQDIFSACLLFPE